ncbi:MAG: hypothetical protein LOD85_04875 [Clostridia bacterium]
MAEWLFWWTLAAMLWLGHWSGVGVFLSEFSRAAALSGAAALMIPGSIEAQLHLFLAAALAQCVLARLVRTRRPPAPHRPPRG